MKKAIRGKFDGLAHLVKELNLKPYQLSSLLIFHFTLHHQTDNWSRNKKVTFLHILVFFIHTDQGVY